MPRNNLLIDHFYDEGINLKLRQYQIPLNLVNPLLIKRCGNTKCGCPMTILAIDEHYGQLEWLCDNRECSYIYFTEDALLFVAHMRFVKSLLIDRWLIYASKD